jgi:regulator of replication initiation timing
MKQEKDNSMLMMQDMRKQKIYDVEEKTIMNMQNNEFRKNIQKQEEEYDKTKNKRIMIKY